MKRFVILSMVLLATSMMGSCSKGNDLTPQEDIVGTWIGQEAKVVVYAEDGIEVISENTISLEDPNYAQVKFNADSTFSLVLRLKTPLLVEENRMGNYKIENNKLTLTFNNDQDEPQEVPYTLTGNQLTFKLGDGGTSTLTYTMVREQSDTEN